MIPLVFLRCLKAGIASSFLAQNDASQLSHETTIAQKKTGVYLRGGTRIRRRHEQLAGDEHIAQPPSSCSFECGENSERCSQQKGS